MVEQKHKTCLKLLVTSNTCTIIAWVSIQIKCFQKCKMSTPVSNYIPMLQKNFFYFFCECIAKLVRPFISYIFQFIYIIKLKKSWQLFALRNSEILCILKAYFTKINNLHIAKNVLHSIHYSVSRQKFDPKMAILLTMRKKLDKHCIIFAWKGSHEINGQDSCSKEVQSTNISFLKSRMP